MGFAGHRHLPLFHGFEQRGLYFRRSAVDFVGENQIAEDRPRLKCQGALRAGLQQRLAAGDVGRQQIRGELDAPHGRREPFGDRLDRARLGQSR